MALNPSNSSNLEQLALKGLMYIGDVAIATLSKIKIHTVGMHYVHGAGIGAESYHCSVRKHRIHNT